MVYTSTLISIPGIFIVLFFFFVRNYHGMYKNTVIPLILLVRLVVAKLVRVVA